MLALVQQFFPGTFNVLCRCHGPGCMVGRTRLFEMIWSASIEAITVSNILFKIALCGVCLFLEFSLLFPNDKFENKTPSVWLYHMHFKNWTRLKSIFYIIFIYRSYHFFKREGKKTPNKQKFSYFKKTHILFIFREGGREGEREGEKHWYERETAVDYLLHAPNQGPGPQLRPVTWPGIKLATFRFAGHRPTHRATPVRTIFLLLT